MGSSGLHVGDKFALAGTVSAVVVAAADIGKVVEWS